MTSGKVPRTWAAFKTQTPTPKRRAQGMQTQGKAPQRQLAAKAYRNGAGLKVVSPVQRLIEGEVHCNGVEKSAGVENGNVIPNTSFKCIVNSIGAEVLQEKELSAEAIEVLHKAAEEHISGLFKKAGKCAVAAKRKTVKLEDINLVKEILKC